MSTKLHFRDYNPKQMLLFPQRLDKDIAENDPVRVVDAVIDSLRLDNFKKLYKERGRSPYHPKMMLKAVIYGYMNNLYSCRKIETALKRDIHFIWLAGYEQPDFNTINRFRNRVTNFAPGNKPTIGVMPFQHYLHILATNETNLYSTIITYCLAFSCYGRGGPGHNVECA